MPVHTFSNFVPGLSETIEEIDTDIAGRNATIQYQDEGVDVSTKGAIQYINFTGTGVTVTSPSAGVLVVDVPSSGGITIGSTAITSGTNDRILYQSGGVVSQSANFVYDGAGHVGIQSTPDSNYGLAIGGTFAGLTISGSSAADFILYHSGSATNAKRSFFRHQSGVGTISTLNDGLGYQVQGVLTWDALTGKVAMGLGATAPSNGQLEVRSTTEQLRLSYDASNYSSTTVGPTGGVTFDAVGSGSKFVFSDAVEVPDDPYNATSWNGSLEIPTKNAIRDKIETLPTAFIGLSDVPASYAGEGGKAVAVNVGETGLEFVAFPSSGSGLTQPQVMARSLGC